MRVIEISAKEVPETQVDRLIHKGIPGMSIERARLLLAEGRVKIRGKVIARNRKLWGTETVQVTFPEPRPIQAWDGPAIPVLHEDDRLLVVNKPPGLTVEYERDQLSIVGLVASQRKGFDVEGLAAPGVVHRLDRETSGCLVLAKTDQAVADLRQGFEDKLIEKRYLALVLGSPPQSGALDTAYARHPEDPRRYTTLAPSPRRARLSYEVQERFADAALVAVQLDTGRTHQIRVQLFEHGYPVIGDPIYGPKEVRTHRAAATLKRLGLHAHRLTLKMGEPLALTAPIPADFEAALRVLRGA